METTQNLTNKIMQLEKKYWQAMQDHDLETALSLTDFPCVVAGPNGMSAVDRSAFEKMFNSGEESTRTFEFDGSPEVRFLNDDTAIAAYKVRCRVKSKDKDQTINAVDTSTWIRRGGDWKCAMHTENELSEQPAN